MIKAQKGYGPVGARLRESLRNAIDRAVLFLDGVGQRFLDRAYEDVPEYGHLRASIGYGIFFDGELLCEGGFESVGDNGDAGAAEGRALLMKIGGDSRGLILVTVAGASYSVYVEASGKPVIANAQLEAESILKKATAR